MNKLFKLFDTAISYILLAIKFIGTFPWKINLDSELFKSGLSVREQIIFMKRLSMMLSSGMPIVYCLRLVALEKSGRNVSSLANNLLLKVESGGTLSSALVASEKIKNPIVTSLVRIGEASGTLPESLDYIARELKTSQEVRRQIISALVYPAIIVLATLGIAIFLITYIFPKITPIFVSLHAELPLSTKLLLGLSQFLTSYSWYVVVFVIMSIIIWSVLIKLPLVRRQLDITLLALPLTGKFIRYYNLANICRTLGLLLSSNVRIIESLNIVALCAPNKIYAESLNELAQNVASGQLLSAQLERFQSLYPPVVVQMTAAGEKTGNLSHTLTFLSDMYESDIRDLTKNLTTILEPVLMLSMGLIVGFIAISIITPIYGITQNLHP